MRKTNLEEKQTWGYTGYYSFIGIGDKVYCGWCKKEVKTPIERKQHIKLHTKAH